MSTGQNIIVNDIILALGGGKRDEEIGESFKVPIEEIIGIRRNFKLLRQYHSTRERTADIISLIKPVFKTLTKDEKLKWAKRLKLSVSQLYRIISKNYDQVTASIPLKPRTTKNREHFESRFYTREAEIKYCSIGDLKSGKRTKSIKGVSKEDLKLSEKYTSVFTNSSIIVEPAPLIAISIVEFKDLWRHFKTSDTPDEDMAKKCGFNIGRIREIRAFHNCEVNHPLKGKELIEDLLGSIESHNLFKLFDRKQKEYSGQSAPEITSIDKICDSYGISRATLYRKLNNMSNIKKKYIPEPPKRCFTIIKINQRWYDVDSFIHGRKSSMRYISFSI